MTGLLILLVYVAIFVGAYFAVKYLVQTTRRDFSSLKTVTFGDESAVVSNRWASVVSVATIFLIWGSFTGSNWVPGFLQAPGPFIGETEFTYTLDDGNGATDDATVFVRVVDFGEDAVNFEVEPGDGMAKDDALAMNASRSKTIIFDKNDEAKRKDGASVVAIEGQPIAIGSPVVTNKGRFALTDKGAINYSPPAGLQMDPVYLPPPEAVVQRLGEIATEGYRNFTLAEHLGYSLFRVIGGFFFGALLG
ncbi:MAG: ABC transporter permease, partial [Arenibacterium sp.]